VAITTPTVILNAFDDTNLGVYDTAAVVLTAGRWYTLTVHQYSSSPAESNATVIHDPTGTPLSFVLISPGAVDARVLPWDVADHRCVEVWAVRPASTTASAVIRIDPTATQSTCGWILAEWSAGVDTTDFAVQVVISTGSSTSAAVTMATYGATDNATFFVAADGTNTGARALLSATESRTELAENTPTEVRSSCANYYQIPHGGDTTLTATLATSQNWGAIGIEVKAAAAGNLSITVNDAVTLTESLTMLILLFPNVFDAVTVAESVVMNLINMPSVFDAVTVSESVTMNVLLMPSVSDSITVAEDSTVLLPFLVPSVSDAVTVAESVTMNVILMPSVNDSVTVAEDVTMNVLLMPNVNDTVTIVESVTMNLLLMPSVSDNVTVADETTVLLPFLVPSVFDAVTVADAVTMNVKLMPNVFDAVTVADDVTVSVVTTEALSISVFDAVTVAEDSTVLLPFLAMGVFDAVSVAEDVTVVTSAVGVTSRRLLPLMGVGF